MIIAKGEGGCVRASWSNVVNSGREVNDSSASKADGIKGFLEGFSTIGSPSSIGIIGRLSYIRDRCSHIRDRTFSRMVAGIGKIMKKMPCFITVVWLPIFRIEH
jgi:hypothetical protein